MGYLPVTIWSLVSWSTGHLPTNWCPSRDLNNMRWGVFFFFSFCECFLPLLPGGCCWRCFVRMFALEWVVLRCVNVKGASLIKMCHRQWKKVVFITVYSVHCCTPVFYYNSRRFFSVSGAELPEIVFISELLAFYFGFLRAQATECLYVQTAVGSRQDNVRYSGWEVLQPCTFRVWQWNLNN